MSAWDQTPSDTELEVVPLDTARRDARIINFDAARLRADIAKHYRNWLPGPKDGDAS